MSMDSNKFWIISALSTITILLYLAFLTADVTKVFFTGVFVGINSILIFLRLKH